MKARFETFGFILILLINFSGIAQNFGLATFGKLPKNLQLYPRQGDNKAIVPIAGSVNIAGYTQIASLITTSQGMYQYRVQNLNNNRFEYSHQIEAKLVNYNLSIYLKSGTDSILVTQVKNIVCGDVFLVYGQSNALSATATYKLKNEFCRGFGVNIDDYNGLRPYNEADTLFSYSDNYNSTPGIWFYKLGQNISEAAQVPLLLLNCAQSGATLGLMIQRNNNLTSAYDKSIYRATKAGVEKDIKGIILWHGESDGIWAETALDWPKNFRTILNYWRQDFGTSPWVYVAQLGVLIWDGNEAFMMKDFQRRIGGTETRLSSFSVMSIPDYDGIHYNIKGYETAADRLTPIVLKDLYGIYKTQRNIDTPNPQKIYYANQNKTVVLEYQNDQDLVLRESQISRNPRPFTDPVYFLKYHFYFDDINFEAVEKVRIDKNKVFLDLYNSSNFSTISYLRKNYGLNNNNAYDGPFIENANGLPSFALFRVPIAKALNPATAVKLNANDHRSVLLTWQNINDVATSFEIQRATNGGAFKKLILTQQTSFLDTTAIEGNRYTYQIFAFNNEANAEKVFADISIKKANAPSNLTINKVSPTQINLSWQDNNVDNDEEFELSISNNADFLATNTKKIKTNTNSFTLDSLSPSKTYFFRVNSFRFRPQIFTEYSNQAEAKTCPQSVDAFSIKDLSNNRLQLNWVETTPDEIGFDLYRAEGGLFKKIAENMPNTTQYTDSVSLDGTAYQYQIIVKNAETCWSEPRQAAIIASVNAPSQLAIDQLKINEAALKWENKSKTATGFEVYLAQDGDFTKLSETAAENTNFVFGQLLPNTEYRVKVLAKNTQAGNSAFSETVTFKTLIITASEPIFVKKGVYPNPASGIINIFANKNDILKVFTTKGQLVKQLYAKNAITNLALPFGQYIIEVTGAKQTSRYKVINN